MARKKATYTKKESKKGFAEQHHRNIHDAGIQKNKLDKAPGKFKKFSEIFWFWG